MVDKNQLNYSAKNIGVTAEIICTDGEKVYYSVYILGKISKRFREEAKKILDMKANNLGGLYKFTAPEHPALFFDILFTAIDRVGFACPAKIYTEYIAESEKRHVGLLAIHEFMDFVAEYADEWAKHLDYCAIFDQLCDSGRHYSRERLIYFMKYPMIDAEKVAQLSQHVFSVYDSDVYARLPRDQLDRIFTLAEPTEQIISETLDSGNKLADLHPAILRKIIALINSREPVTGNLVISIDNFKLFTTSYIEYLENKVTETENEISQAEIGTFVRGLMSNG